MAKMKPKATCRVVCKERRDALNKFVSDVRNGPTFATTQTSWNWEQPNKFEEKFNRVADVLVGLWKFRVKDKPLLWCCTYVLDGMYYDTFGAPTPNAALDRVYRVLAKRRRNHK